MSTKYLSFSNINTQSSLQYIIKNIGFIDKLGSVQCNPFHFKYISLLLQNVLEIVNNDKIDFNKYTTQQFDDLFYRQKEFCVKGYPVPIGDIIRFKSLNGDLYYDSNITTDFSHYHRSFISYFIHLFKRYSTYIPNFDLTIFVSDSFEHRFDWTYSPCFIAEGMHHASNTKLNLHIISRALVRDLYHPLIYPDLNETNKIFEAYYRNLSWKNKINKAIFRGSPFGHMRDDIIFYINNNISSQQKQYFDAKMVHVPEHINEERKKFCGKDHEMKYKCWIRKNESISSIDELKYKYMIVLDGLGVRDSFTRQMKYNSIMLKRDSKRREFWYYDLINGYNYFLFKNGDDLNALMNKLQNNYNEEQLSNIAANAYQYAMSHFNIDSMDCFTLQMLHIYNHFFYDNSSLTINQQYDIKIAWNNETDISKYMFT